MPRAGSTSKTTCAARAESPPSSHARPPQPAGQGERGARHATGFDEIASPPPAAAGRRPRATPRRPVRAANSPSGCAGGPSISTTISGVNSTGASFPSWSSSSPCSTSAGIRRGDDIGLVAADASDGERPHAVPGREEHLVGRLPVDEQAREAHRQTHAAEQIGGVLKMEVITLAASARSTLGPARRTRSRPDVPLRRWSRTPAPYSARARG